MAVLPAKTLGLTLAMGLINPWKHSPHDLLVSGSQSRDAMQRKMAFPQEAKTAEPRLGGCLVPLVSMAPKNSAALSPKTPSQAKSLRNEYSCPSTTGHLVYQRTA